MIRLTASGFVVRQTQLASGDLQHPTPQRPHQVKKIANMYKDKSLSLLRLVGVKHGSTEQ